MKLVAQGSMSTVSKSWNYICSKYWMDRLELRSYIQVNMCFSTVNDSDLVKAGLIRDLILYRNCNSDDQNVKYMINQLCTDKIY